jgi:hypothetical protein
MKTKKHRLFIRIRNGIIIVFNQRLHFYIQISPFALCNSLYHSESILIFLIQVILLDVYEKCTFSFAVLFSCNLWHMC